MDLQEVVVWYAFTCTFNIDALILVILATCDFLLNFNLIDLPVIWVTLEISFHLQVSVVDELGIPVKFVGVGEGVEDLQPFDAEAFVNAIFSWGPTYGQ